MDKVPAPGEYGISRELQLRTSTFGLGREKVALNGIIPRKMYKGESPGPGMYPLDSMKSTISFSFRKKLKPELTTNMFSPGPNRVSFFFIYM